MTVIDRPFEPPLPAPLDVGHRRSLELDLLRCVAVVLVLGRHWLPVYFQQGSLPAPLNTWYRGGWIGVDLFFVLSGFLVSGLLFREQVAARPLRPLRFLIRRGFRIYPPFYVFLILSTLGLEWFSLPGVNPRKIVGETLFIQNYFDGIWNHTWSLAVEEHFYLFVPAVLMLFAAGGKRRLGGIAAFTATVCIACTWARILAVSHEKPNVSAPPTETHLRIDSLMIGVLTAAAFHFHHERFCAIVRRRAAALLLAGTVLLLPPFVFDLQTAPWLRTWGLTLLYVGGACIVGVAACCPLRRNPTLATLGLVGSYSYSIYLWHMPLSLAFYRLHWRSWPAFVAYVGAAVLIGIAAAVLVEGPSMRLRERLFPSRVDPAAAA